MKWSAPKYLLMALLLGLAAMLKAQVNAPWYQLPAYNKAVQYGSSEGLISSEVHCLLQAQDGTLWIGTDHGLCSFDSERWKYYTLSDGLGDGMITEIREDSEARLWIKGLNETLCRLNPGTGEVSMPAFNQQLRLKKQTRTIAHWKLDAQGNGHILVFEYLLESRQGIPSYQLYHMANFAAVDSNYVDFSECNAFRLPKPAQNAWVFNRSRSTEPKAHSDRHFVDTAGYLLWKAGTSLPGTKQKETVRSTPACIPLKNGKTLLHVNNYLLVIDSNPKAPLVYHTLEQDINEVYQDAAGNIWVAQAWQNGVLCFEKGDLQKTPGHYLKGLTPTSFLEDSEGNFWIGTLQKGMLHFSKALFTQLTLPNGLQDVSSLNSRQGTFYLVGNGKEALELQLGKGLKPEWNTVYASAKRITDYWCEEDTCFACQGSHLYTAMHPFETWRLMGSIEDRGMGKALNIGKKRLFAYSNFSYTFFHRYEEKRLHSSLELDQYFRVNCAHPLNADSIVIGTNRGLKLATTTGQLPFLDTVVPIDHVYDLVRDPWKHWWIATKGHGLLHLDAQGKLLETYTMENGLPRNAVKDLEITADSMLYGIAEIGLFALPRKLPMDANKTVKVWTTQDNNLPADLNKIASNKEHLLVAGKLGLYAAPLALLKKESNSPVLQLKQVSVNDLHRSVQSLEQLKATENNLNVQFGSFHYGKATPTYWYSLTGGKNWIPTRDHEINLIDQKPGEHELMIASQPRFDPATDLRIPYSIAEPFTQSALFLLVVVLGSAGLVFFVLWVFLMRERLAKRLLLSQQQALTAQMNPHFIFNALNSIYYFVGKKEKLEAQNYISEFAFLMRQVLSASRSGDTSLEKELKSLKAYLELEELRFSQAHAIEIDIAPEVEAQLKNLRIPGMIIQPYLENAIVHGLFPLEHPGRLVLSMRLQNDLLEVRIEDNGVGRKKALEKKRDKSHESHGSSITAERIALLNQKSSRQISAHIEDLMPHGTRVVLKIPVFQ